MKVHFKSASGGFGCALSHMSTYFAFMPRKSLDNEWKHGILPVKAYSVRPSPSIHAFRGSLSSETWNKCEWTTINFYLDFIHSLFLLHFLSIF